MTAKTRGAPSSADAPTGAMAPREWAVLFGLGLIWGTSYLFIKVAVQEFPPPTLVAVRLGLAAVCLAPVVWMRGLNFPRDARTWTHLTTLGTVNAAVPITLIAWGEQSITSAAASVLNATTPLWSALLAHLVGEEVLSVRRVVGVALGLGGVVVLLGLDPAELGRGHLLGSLAVVVASALYAVGILYARNRLGHLHPLVVSAGSLVGGTAFLLPAAVAAGFPAQPTLGPVASLLALSVFGTGVAYLLYFHLVMTVSPTQTALVTYLNPATAVFWGWLVLGEAVTGQTLGGLALILAGIALASRSAPTRESRVVRRTRTAGAAARGGRSQGVWRWKRHRDR